MANWIGAITNAGNNLLTKWVDGKILTFESAAAGAGTVAAEALLTQTALVNKKQIVQIIGSERVSNGIRLKLRVTAPKTGYTLNQFGIWANVGGGAATMIALFQHGQGIPIPGANEAPDFVYTFFATVMVSNVGKWTINIDTSALATMKDLEKKLDCAGGTMSGNLYMNGNTIFGAYSIAAKRGNFSDGISTGGAIAVSGNNGDPLFAITGRKHNAGGDITVELFADTPNTNILLSGLSSPIHGNEAANKDYVDDRGNKSGNGAPNSSTPGFVGQFYMDTVSFAIYKCVSADGRIYKWLPL